MAKANGTSTEKPAAVPAKVWGVSGDGDAGETRQLLAEDFLTIEVEGAGGITLMCTPKDTLALAVGFAYTEGIIESLDNLALVTHCPDNHRLIRIRLSTEPAAIRRMSIVVSACGLCGTTIPPDELMARLGQVGTSLRISRQSVLDMPEKMRQLQALYSRTGAAHAAAIFNAAGDSIAFAEDVGRHNALDKAIGKALLARRPLAGCAAAFSGRVSFEILQKSVRAGIELIAAVSAATALAVEAAQKAGVTLCGMVRDGSAVVYTHPQRLA